MGLFYKRCPVIDSVLRLRCAALPEHPPGPRSLEPVMAPAL